MTLSVLMKYINQNPSTSKNVRFYKVGILKHYIEILKSGYLKRVLCSESGSSGVRVWGPGI